MKDLEAIRRRVSRRTYRNELLSEQDKEALLSYVTECNQESGLSFLWVEDGKEAFQGLNGYGMFKGVRSLIVFKAKKGIPHLQEKVGYYGEKIVLEATKMGLGTCWVAGTYNSIPTWSSDDEEVVCVVPVGYVEEEKSMKEKLISKASHLKKKGLMDIGSFDESKSWFIEGLNAVKQAPSALNKQPVRFELKDNQVTVFLEKENKYSWVDLGIAKYHFEVATGLKIPFGNPVSIRGKGDKSDE